MKHLILTISIIYTAITGYCQTTYCNPMNLNYRYCISRQNWGSVDSTQSYREGADPTMLLFKNEYYLFVSKSGGYWHSKDMLHWDFITSTDIPWEEYAPTVCEIDGKVFYMAAGQGLYCTSDPKSGKWEFVRRYKFSSFTDPCLFLDDNKRLYLYYGSSDALPLYGIELDINTDFEPFGKPKAMISLHPDQYGWENKGWENVLNIPNPWLEGAWVNKYEGKYYLQYASPLQGRDYCDAVYISNSPLGPYKVADQNPFAYKPTGFAMGAGHGNTFQDLYGNYWHTGTVGINTKHLFERRVNLLPAGFDGENNLYSDACFGDYPHYIPYKPVTDISELFTGWMLLSYNKPVEASSVLDTFYLKNAVDENIRTFWSAKTGKKGEWLSIDLLKDYNVYALQINFSDNDVKILGRPDYKTYQYVVEYSNDKLHWNILIDKTNNTNDFSHDYTELGKPVKARYLRIINLNIPDGKFAISGFRVFGKGNGELPQKVQNITIKRNSEDKKMVKISWDRVPGATGYNIRYGISKDKLYLNYQLYSDNTVVIHSLNRNLDYYFTIDAFNENGVSKGETIVRQ